MNKLKEYIFSLTDFSEESWAICSGCLTETKLKRNEALLKEGQICNAIFFIETGLCKSVFNRDGKEVNTAFYFENEFATNIKSLTMGSPSEYSIVACEKSVVIRLDKSGLLEAYRKSHEVEAFGRKTLEAITARQEEETNDFKLLSPQQRYQKLALEHPDFLQRVSLTQLASYLGISRETMSRIRARR